MKTNVNRMMPVEKNLDNSFDYFAALVDRGISESLLQSTIQQDPTLNLKSIYNLSGKISGVKFQYDWQLKILGGSDFGTQSIEFWKLQDNRHATPVHYLSWSGNLEKLKLVVESDSELLDVRDAYHHTIVDYAVFSECASALLSYIHVKKPVLLDSQGMTFVHQAQVAESIETLNWIKTNVPGLFNKVDDDGFTCIEQAVLNEQLEILRWANENTSLLMERNQAGLTIAQFAAKHGKTKTLSFLLQFKRELFSRNSLRYSRHGQTIAHYAVSSGKPEGLLWVMANDPSLLIIADNRGYNILHKIVETERDELFTYLIEHYPVLTKKLWIKTIQGETPQEVFESRCFFEQRTPNFLRDKALLVATNRIIAGDSSQKDNDLLLAFHEEWKNMILNYGEEELIKLLNKMPCFPVPLQNILNNLPVALRLRAFIFYGGNITLGQLNDLYHLAKQTLPRSWIMFGSTEPKLLQEIRSLLTHTQQGNTIEKKVVWCLTRLVLDYKQDLLGPKDDASELFINKLLQSKTLNELHLNQKPITFLELMSRSIRQEYQPYAELVVGISENERLAIEPLCDFILARHENESCLADDFYAPSGIVMRASVAKYFETMYPQAEDSVHSF